MLASVDGRPSIDGRRPRASAKLCASGVVGPKTEGRRGVMTRAGFVATFGVVVSAGGSEVVAEPEAASGMALCRGDDVADEAGVWLRELGGTLGFESSCAG